MITITTDDKSMQSFMTTIITDYKIKRFSFHHTLEDSLSGMIILKDMDYG